MNEDTLWSFSADKTARKWDLETQKCELKLEHPDYVKSLTVLGNGWIATGCRDEHIRLWDPTTEKCTKIIKGHFGEIERLQVVGGTLYSGALDSTLRSWNLLDPNLGEEPEEEEEEEEAENLMTEEEERELAELMDE